MKLNAIERGTGPPLVLLHGLFGSARNFGAVQKRLADCWRVIALDLRNHGASPHAPGMGYADQAADVRETLAALGALPTMLVGHSMGGKAAMRVALDWPDSVSRLVVADIAPVAHPPHFRGYAQAMAALRLTPGLSRAEADAALADTVPEAAVRAFLLQNFLPGTPAAWRIGLAEIAAALPEIAGWDNPANAAFRGPTLFLRGERSDYVLPEHRSIIRQLFPAARFATLKRAGHWLHADQPEAFVAAVEAFLGAG